MADEGTISADGTIEWRDAEGRQDGSAVVHANGSVKYYLDGVRHREGGPACVYVNGTEKWYREGLRHRGARGSGRDVPWTAETHEVSMAESGKVRNERRSRTVPSSTASAITASNSSGSAFFLFIEFSDSCFVTTHNGVTPSHAQRGKIWRRDAKTALGAFPRPHSAGSASDPRSRVAHWA
jgi:hypothetical protein